MVIYGYARVSTAAQCRDGNGLDDQIAGKGVFNETHIQNMNTDTSVKQFSDSLDSLDSSSGKAIQFAYYQCISLFQYLQKFLELGPFHGLTRKGLINDFLASILLERGYLLFQTVSVPTLSRCRYSCIAVNHCFHPLLLTLSFGTHF